MAFQTIFISVVFCKWIDAFISIIAYCTVFYCVKQWMNWNRIVYCIIDIRIVANAWKLFRTQKYATDDNSSSSVSLGYSFEEDVYPAIFFHFQLNSYEPIDHVVRHMYSLLLLCH